MNKTDRARIAKALTAAADSLEGSKVKAAGTPRVFVGLVQAPALGEWIDVEDDEDAMDTAIQEVVEKAKQKVPDAEEYMFSDYEGMPNLGEHASVADIVKMADLLSDHDEVAVEAAYSLTNDLDDAEELLDNGYGVYDSETEYAEQYVDDMGGPSELGEEIVNRYIDYQKLARDLMHDVNLVYVDGTPYAFYNI